MNSELLTVYSSPFRKERIGRNFDGGYVVCDIPNAEYDILLSAGIDRDTSFEDAWLTKYPSKKCIAFDGTIDNCPSTHPNFTWIKKNITAKIPRKPTLLETLIKQPIFTNETNLHDILNSHKSIFLKMDIEGYEIPWLETLTPAHMDSLSQIVIEFHSPFSERESYVFEKINKTHILLHIHGNNCCGTRLHDGVVIPNIFECTYIHKRYVTSPLVLNEESLPSNLDEPNVQDKEDISLDYKPFVNI
jgi:hypothetical protein